MSSRVEAGWRPERMGRGLESNAAVGPSKGLAGWGHMRWEFGVTQQASHCFREFT